MKLIGIIAACLLAFCAARDEDHLRKSSVKPFVAPINPVVNVMEASMSFWRQKAQSFITSKLGEKINKNKAKNIIFFLGDGMSIPTVAAARMSMGKEEAELSFDKFPHYGLTKTYCVDMTVPDSACTATAYLSGVKCNYRGIGVNANIGSTQCDISEDDFVYSIAQWAQNAGKGTGIVTTARITHASPAGVYANVPHRDWEHNNLVPEACRGAENIRDIAHQLVYNEVGKKLKVILGGGRAYFLNTTMSDDEGQKGFRTDGRNLIDEWVIQRAMKGETEFIWHRQQLRELDVDKTDYLLGLFEPGHCLYHLDIMNNNLQHQEPTLTEMTSKAIKMLQKEENGYFLFVEGGRIDMAHHDNWGQKAMEETKEFSRAVDVARQMTNEDDTLIVVTSDHSHSFTFNGIQDRGNNILGAYEISEIDGKVYDTLSYANGPGYGTTFEGGQRVNLSMVDLKNPNRPASATVPLDSETHGGDDVGVYASGPWSHLFVGSYEQNNIPLLMAYAAQIGAFNSDTETTTNGSTEDTTTDSASYKQRSLVIFVFILLLSVSL